MAAVVFACAASAADVISESNTITTGQIGFTIYAEYGDIDTEWMYWGISDASGTWLWGYCTNTDAPGVIEDTPSPNNGSAFPSGVYRFEVLPYPWNSATQPAADFYFAILAASPTLTYATATGSFVQLNGVDLIGGSSVTISGGFLSALGIADSPQFGNGLDTSSFRYSLDGGDYVAPSGASSFDWNQFTLVLNNLADAQHHLSFRITDIAGNVGEAGYDFIYDSTAPTLSMPSGTIRINDPNVNITINISDASGIDWSRTSISATSGVNSWVDGSASTATVFASTALNAGDEFDFNLTATDIIGNQSSLAVHVIYDPRPTVIAVGPLDNTWITTPTPYIYADFNVPFGTLVGASFTINGTPVATGGPDGNRVWPVEFNLAADGNYVVEVVGTTSAGFASVPYDWTLKLDGTPPTITPTNIEQRFCPLFETSFNFVDGSTALFAIADPVDSFGNPGSGVNSAYAFEGDIDHPIAEANYADGVLSVPLEVGTHSLLIYAVDNAGNWNSNYIDCIVDTGAPGFTNFSPANGTVVDASQFSGQFTTAGIPIDYNTFTVTCDQVTGYYFWTADDSGFVIYTGDDGPLPDGDVTFELTVADIYGVQSDPYYYTVTIDQTGLQLAFVDENDEPYPVEGPNATWTIMHSTGWTIVTLDENDADGQNAQPVAYTQTANTFTVQPVGNGTHYYSIILSDAAGVHTDWIWAIVVNRIPPQVVFDSPSDYGYLYNPAPRIEGFFYLQGSHSIDTGSLTITLVGSDNANHAVSRSFNGSGFTLFPLEDLPEGNYTVTGRVADDVGNWSDIATRHIGVDRTPPAISGQFPAPGSQPAIPYLTIAANLTDALSGVDPNSLDVYLDGQPIAYTFNSSGTGFVSPVDISQSPLSAHSIEFTYSDVAGNSGTTAGIWNFTFPAGQGFPAIPPSHPSGIPRPTGPGAVSSDAPRADMYPGYGYWPGQWNFAIEAISFSNAIEIRDNAGIVFSEPQFKPVSKFNLYGNPTLIDEHWDYPLAFSAKTGNTVKVKVIFSPLMWGVGANGEADAASLPFSVQGHGPVVNSNGKTLEFPPELVTVQTMTDGKKYYVYEAESKPVDSFETNKVQFFQSFDINWEYDKDGQQEDWPHLLEAPTRHTVYVVSDDPVGSPCRYQTAYYLACNKANGLLGANPAGKAAIVEKIFDAFAAPVFPGRVKCVDYKGNEYGNAFAYWGPFSFPPPIPPPAGSPPGTPPTYPHNDDWFIASGLIKNQDGRCGAWSQLNQHAIQLNGIDATISSIAGKRADGVKTTTTVDGQTVIRDEWRSNTLFAKATAPGQNNAAPNFRFADHAVVKAAGTTNQYFDPSYGNKYLTFLALQTSEFDGFTWFVTRWVNDVFSGSPDGFIPGPGTPPAENPFPIGTVLPGAAGVIYDTPIKLESTDDHR